MFVWVFFSLNLKKKVWKWNFVSRTVFLKLQNNNIYKSCWMLAVYMYIYIFFLSFYSVCAINSQLCGMKTSCLIMIILMKMITSTPIKQGWAKIFSYSNIFGLELIFFSELLHYWYLNIFKYSPYDKNVFAIIVYCFVPVFPKM